MNVDLLELAKLALQQGMPFFFLCAIGLYWARVIQPKKDARDDLRDKERYEQNLERDRSQAALLAHQQEENARLRRESLEREDRIRSDHKEAWKEDRLMLREMIERISSTIDKNTERTENNFGLLMAIGENQGMTKRNMIARTQSIVGREIDQPNIDTKGD